MEMPSSNAEGKLCMDCQKVVTEINETIRLKCNKHFICESCCDTRDLLPKFRRKIRECQSCHPDVFQAQLGIFVDDSNLWIEGKKAYANYHGLSTVEDPQARFDFKELMKVTTGKGQFEVGARKLYGSVPPPADTVWAKVEEQGWELILKKKSHHTGKEKQIDTQLVVDVTSLVKETRSGTVIIVSGDSDYIPAIEVALKHGWKVEVWSWEKALSADIRHHERKGKGLCVKYLNDHMQVVTVNRYFDPTRFTEKDLLSRLNDAAILLTVDGKEGMDLQGSKKWKKFTDDLQKITKWPIVYHQVGKSQGYVEVLAIFLTVNDKRPCLKACINEIKKTSIKKKLSLTSDPITFSRHYKDLGSETQWLKPLFSKCKVPDVDNGDDASDTQSVRSVSSKSRNSSKPYKASSIRYKTVRCRYFDSSSCSKGDKCNYAHGEHDPEAYCTRCERQGHVESDCKCAKHKTLME